MYLKLRKYYNFLEQKILDVAQEVNIIRTIIQYLTLENILLVLLTSYS